MTNKQAYERIRSYFSRKGARLARTENGECIYRLNGNPRSHTKCAVGCLIPNDQYNPRVENLSAEYLVRNNRIPALVGIDPDFLQSAQNMHDDADNVEEFLRELDRLAKHYI